MIIKYRTQPQLHPIIIAGLSTSFHCDQTHSWFVFHVFVQIRAFSSAFLLVKIILYEFCVG